jgi:hydroxyacylglutathione hydrolase
VLIDSNGVTDPLVERAEREGTKISHLLLTHSHVDHVAEAEVLAERVGAEIVAHPDAAEQLEFPVGETISGGQVTEIGKLRIEAIETPGHTAGHLAFLINGSDCVTADCLFKGTVGGTKAPGATGFDDLRRSIMERLMDLPPETRIHPGHRQPSTIGAEWESNPFIRIWRGLDEEGTETCSVGSGDSDASSATLVLWAPDYDGGNKAWVRFADGSDEIVGGSQVQRKS